MCEGEPRRRLCGQEVSHRYSSCWLGIQVFVVEVENLDGNAKRSSRVDSTDETVVLCSQRRLRELASPRGWFSRKEENQTTV